MRHARSHGRRAPRALGARRDAPAAQAHTVCLNTPHAMKKYQGPVAPHRRRGLRELRGGGGRDRASTRAALVVETPPDPEMGDIAFPMFPFAKALRKAPPVIAAEVARRVAGIGGCGGRGNRGRGRAVRERAARAGPPSSPTSSPRSPRRERLRQERRDWAATRVMLEFSCPNTNKPLHLGHLQERRRRREPLAHPRGGRCRRAEGQPHQRPGRAHLQVHARLPAMFGGGATPESHRHEGRPLRRRLLREVRAVREGPPRGRGAGPRACCGSGRKGTPRSSRSGAS